jgi:hypothetical protein
MSDFPGIFNLPDVVIFSSSEGTLQESVKIGSFVFGFALERKRSLKVILFFMRLGER